MKPLYTILTGILFIVFSTNASSTFTLSCSNAQVDNVDSFVASTIEITENTIIWTQHHTNTDTPISFDITSQNGSWDNPTSTGQVNYTLTQEGYQANFNVTGTSSGVTAEFTFHITDSQQETYNFTVNSINY